MEKEIVLITGGTSMIAKRLTVLLQDKYTLRYLTRTKAKSNDFLWNIRRKKIDKEALKGVHHIIHLAGANIAEKRWTSKRKKEILKSRTDSAALLLEAVKSENIVLKSFISASAVGYYGTLTSEIIFKESDAVGSDFLSEVTYRWEEMADAFFTEKAAERVVKLRTSMVLSNNGGALPKISKPINYYFGAAIGSGKQFVPWIHIDDLCNMYRFALENKELHGSFNASAPEHVNNNQFTKAVAKSIKKPIFLPNIPGFVLKIALGELSVILLKGSRINSEKIIDKGFKFNFPYLKEALSDLKTNKHV